MWILGLIIVVLLVGGSAYFAGQAIKSAHEAGKLAATPKTGTRKARAKTTARNAPHNVRTILAQAYADNWVAKRAHAREHRPAAPPALATPKPPRRTVLRRLIAPAGSPQATPPQAVPAAAAAPPAAGTNGHRPGAAIPSTPATAATPRPTARPQLVPVPDPTNGRPAPMPSSPSPTGAAADMFSAATVVTSHAKSGGIHAKLRAIKVFSETFENLHTTLRDLATDMSEQGEYPASVWEPVMTAAAHAKATAMSLGEADSSLVSLMNMNIGELAASPIRAPRNAELNRA
jgi:hypothetical protein